MCLKIFPLTLLLLLNIPATSLASPPQPTAFSVGGFEFQRPEGFQWIATTSSLRKAELRVHKQDWPEPVQVLFFHFGPDQGGTIEANISRWLSQFQEPVEKLNAQRADQTVGKTKITMLRAKGTFLSGMPGQQPT
ncbi:MAG: hypothetical protein NZL93_06185, partial [Chthoniobacterales bacterium]|nr:hypothetical protein [Chthoniobacterales bacterium]